MDIKEMSIKRIENHHKKRKEEISKQKYQLLNCYGVWEQLNEYHRTIKPQDMVDMWSRTKKTCYYIYNDSVGEPVLIRKKE